MTGNFKNCMNSIWTRMTPKTKKKFTDEVITNNFFEIDSAVFFNDDWIMEVVPVEYRTQIMELAECYLKDQNMKKPRLIVKIPKENIIKP